MPPLLKNKKNNSPATGNRDLVNMENRENFVHPNLRKITYFLRLRASIDRLISFPGFRRLQLSQGMTNIKFCRDFSRKPPVFRDRFRPPVYALKPPVFLFSSKKSQICYTYSLKSSKNSASNASLLKQLKKPERIAKIQDRYVRCGLYKLPNVIAMSVENLSC